MGFWYVGRVEKRPQVLKIGSDFYGLVEGQKRFVAFSGPGASFNPHPRRSWPPYDEPHRATELKLLKRKTARLERRTCRLSRDVAELKAKLRSYSPNIFRDVILDKTVTPQTTPIAKKDNDQRSAGVASVPTVADIKKALDNGLREEAVELWLKIPDKHGQRRSHKQLYLEADVDRSDYDKWRKGRKFKDSSRIHKRLCAILTSAN
jgi:hypothetical protein